MVNYLIVSLSDLYDVAKEKVENSFLGFSWREKDIEDFLKYKAVDYEYLGRGKTFLVLNEDYLDEGELEIIAFLTTAITAIDLSELSKSRRKKILDDHPNHLSIPAFLIGQIGRSDRYTSEDFQGETLLKECCTTLKRAQDIIGVKKCGCGM